MLSQCPTSNFLVVHLFNLPIVNSLAIPNPFIFCWLSISFHLQPSPTFLVSFLSFCVTRSFEIVSLMKFQASCRNHSLFYNRGGSSGNLQIINSFFLRAESKYSIWKYLYFLSVLFITFLQPVKGKLVLKDIDSAITEIVSASLLKWVS